MLHELLVSLRGHAGYIFIEDNDKICVNPTISLLHPCEVMEDRAKCLDLDLLTNLVWSAAGGHPEQSAGAGH